MGTPRIRNIRDVRRMQDDEAEKLQARQKQRYVIYGSLAGALILVTAGWLALRPRATPTGTTDPEVMVRMRKLFELYKAFAQTNKSRGPANEQGLKEFYAKLPPDQQALYGDNVDVLLQNPQSGDKYEVRWGVRLDPGGPNQGVIWEKQSTSEYRYVALTMGYVARLHDNDFAELKKR